MPMHPCEFGTIAVMPAAAFTHKAGSRQRERGELPQQPWGSAWDRSLTTGWGSTD